MSIPPEFARYDRQWRYPPLGIAGQQKLATSRVLLCGCGALGTMLANHLVRAGVGHLRIVDRDFVETNNLQRQVLFDEQDVADAVPKAVAAADKLRRINSQVTIEPVVADLDVANIRQLAEGADLLLDGTDNFETRYLLNDLAIEQQIPWVYGGVIGAEGQTMTIVPGQSACLRCLMSEPPPAGSTPTCETAGILGPIVGVIASIQAAEALKILSGHTDAASRQLTVVELWEARIRQIDLSTLRDSVDCPCCRRRQFDWLSGQRGAHSAVLCGRNAVQLHPGDTPPLDLAALADKLTPLGTIRRTPYLLRFGIESFQLTIFPDGRAIVAGTDDLAQARSLYARYVGS